MEKWKISILIEGSVYTYRIVNVNSNITTEEFNKVVGNIIDDLVEVRLEDVTLKGD
jgi:hypothetical protein